MVAKPWGRDTLPAPFVAPSGERIGEIWFEPPHALDQLLIKYIFTSEKLSVQVHPSDAQTLAAGIGRQGKEECWLVLDAEPGATLGVGFRETISAADMRAAALDGRIEALLAWHPVQRGDFFYIPANTVHAIGAGVSLIEIQQNSDITYRLFDYGRPRELHLDEGMAVAKGQVYDLARGHRRIVLSPPSATSEGSVMPLVEGPLFRLDLVAGYPDASALAGYDGAALLVVPVTGAVAVNGEALAPGGCGLAASPRAVDFASDGLCLVTQPIVASPPRE